MNTIDRICAAHIRILFLAYAINIRIIYRIICHMQYYFYMLPNLYTVGTYIQNIKKITLSVRSLSFPTTSSSKVIIASEEGFIISVCFKVQSVLGRSFPAILRTYVSIWCKLMIETIVPTCEVQVVIFIFYDKV